MKTNENLCFENINLINFINLTSEESEIVRAWRNHENIRKYLFQDHAISLEEHQGFLKRLKSDCKNIFWLAKNKDGKYLGVISLYKIDRINKNAYLGVYSNPLESPKGTGSLLMECLRYIVFDILSLHTLKLEVIDRNERAKNFYLKQGFIQEGRLTEFVLRDGVWTDVIIMGIKK